MTTWKKFVWNLCKFIKNKKRKKNHMYISIHSLCSILCWSIFGTNYSLKSFWVWCDKLWISAFGNNLPFFSSPRHLSSSVRLDGGRHTFSGFSRNIWLGSIPGCGWTIQGHSQSSLQATLAVCLGSLSCWKVNLLPSLRFWMLWTGFSLRLSQYFGALSFSSTLMSPSVPGMVLCRWWAELVYFKHDA